MKASDNSTAKSAVFDAKKPYFASSPYALTKQLGEASDWTPAEIADRQRKLAKIAIKTWPV